MSIKLDDSDYVLDEDNWLPCSMGEHVSFSTDCDITYVFEGFGGSDSGSERVIKDICGDLVEISGYNGEPVSFEAARKICSEDLSQK